jgi:hypothetical protein
MRRFRIALLIPALAAVGGVVGATHSAPVAAAASSHAVAWCIIDPITERGCLPVPCPKPLICFESAAAPAVAAKI